MPLVGQSFVQTLKKKCFVNVYPMQFNLDPSDMRDNLINLTNLVYTFLNTVFLSLCLFIHTKPLFELLFMVSNLFSLNFLSNKNLLAAVLHFIGSVFGVE